jgi:uncharacterized SAM-dependent methyltransferase
MVWTGGENLDSEVDRYLLFYEWIERRLESVVLADFSTVTTDFNAVIQGVNKRFGTSFNCVDNLEEATVQVRQDIQERFLTAENDQSVKRFPLPVRARNQIGQLVRVQVTQHRWMNSALELYARLREKSLAQNA